jgi:hypothetical protein
MSYTAPAGTAVDFDFTDSGYTPPAGGAVNFDFYNVPPHQGTLSAELDAPTAGMLVQHDDPSGLPIISAVIDATLDGPSATLAAEFHPPHIATLAADLDPPTAEASAQFTRIHIASATAILDAPQADMLADFFNGRVITLQATLDAPTASVSAARGNTATATATFELPDIQIGTEWGAKIPVAGISDSTSAGGGGFKWGRAAAADRALTAISDAMRRIEPETESGWQEGQAADAAPAMPHNQMITLDDGAQVPYSTHIARDRQNRQGYIVPPAQDQSGSMLWDRFSAEPSATPGHGYGYPPPKDKEKWKLWMHVDYWANKLPRWDTRDYTPPVNNAVNFDFSDSGYDPDMLALDFSWGTPSPYPNQPIMPTDPSTGIGHNVPPTIDQINRVPWGTGSWTRPYPDYGPDIPWPNDPTEDPAERPPQPDIREVYLFMPNITLYRLPDGAEFEASQCVWSTDRDSWGWRFTANLKRDTDLAIIKPTSNGPVEIGCEINGHTFTALVESYGRSRQHGNTRYTISGRSRTAWLSDPYAPQRSKALTAAYSAAALAEQELANTGFSLQWNAKDWLIPAGSYSYDQLDPIAAIKRLAEAAGYMLQSHPELKQLIVSPRYRVDPHKWTEPTTALDAILPADLITQDGSTFRTAPAYNRAIVTGGPAGGVIVTVTRDGTAGDILAPMATDDLITHSDAGYQRGRSLIAEGGTWEEMSITTMLTQAGQAPGLLLPGHLVEIQDTDDTYPVVIDGTSITATSSDTEIKVRQALTAERRIW